MKNDWSLRGPDLLPGLFLGFVDPVLEKQFKDFYTSFYYRFAQASLGLGLLLILGDFFVDFLVYPDVTANYYRLSLCVPILLTTLAYSFFAHARAYWESVMSVVIVLISMSIFWLLQMIDRQGGQGLHSWVGILNFSILELYCFVILGARFSHALPGGLIILVGFEWAMYQDFDANLGKIAYLSYHAVTMAIICAMIGWWRELLLRKNYAANVAVSRFGETQETERSLLEATLEASNNGILVVNNEGLITSTNQRFAKMWGISPEMIALRDDSKLLQCVVDQLKDPQQFLNKVKDLYGKPEAVSRDRLAFLDGRIFERFSHPQRFRNKIVGRVWSFSTSPTGFVQRGGYCTDPGSNRRIGGVRAPPQSAASLIACYPRYGLDEG